MCFFTSEGNYYVRKAYIYREEVKYGKKDNKIYLPVMRI